ncbi:MAG TPA: hypothetical protein VHR27_01035, partial [Blastocatellia bacterium]|nr:hypothetical protein [Blastocatellia bacterium]
LVRTDEIISPLKWNCDSRKHTYWVGLPLWLESYAAALTIVPNERAQKRMKINHEETKNAKKE